MMIIVNNIIPFKGYIATNLFGVLFVRQDLLDMFTIVDRNHEEIHTKQIKELLYVGFYVWYFIEWLIRVLFSKDRFSHKAYRAISFEREAYQNESDFGYIENRKHFSFIKYI